MISAVFVLVAASLAPGGSTTAPRSIDIRRTLNHGTYHSQ